MLRLSKFMFTCLIAGVLVFAPIMAHGVSANAQTHTVSRGDTLWLISNWYGVSLNDLRSTNNIWGNNIYPGQRVTIPGSSTENNNRDQGSSSSTSHRRLWVSDYERNLMARAVYSESIGEPYEGKVGVAAVIINRVLDNRWPNTVEGVIFEPWAFTPVHDGRFWLTPNQTAYNAVEDALRGWDPSHGATFFYNPVTATSSWIFSRTTVTQIGRHIFAY